MRHASVLVLGMALAGTAAPAFADANAIAKAHSDAFGKACGAGDVKAVLALYADDAYVIWPGAGEEAKGKAAIEKLATGLCDPKLGTKAVLTSSVGLQLDPTHVAILSHWDFTQNGPDGKPVTSQIRTSEIVVKTKQGWRYVVDHASIGMPPAEAVKTTGLDHP
jgi:ketosteroid isomerase-like protein